MPFLFGSFWQCTAAVQGELFPGSLLKGKYGEMKGLKKVLLRVLQTD